MRRLGLAVIVSGLLLPSAWAGRASFLKSTGELLEYQSAATPGTLLHNAENSGFQSSQVEERELTKEEWRTLQQELEKPAKQAQQRREVARQSAKKKLKDLGLTDGEVDALFE